MPNMLLNIHFQLFEESLTIFSFGEGSKVFLEPFPVPMPAGLEGPPWQDAETVESTAHVATGRRKRLEMTVIEPSVHPYLLNYPFSSAWTIYAAWTSSFASSETMAHMHIPGTSNYRLPHNGVI